MQINAAMVWFFFFFNDTATTEIYTLSLHDALPISSDFSKQEEIVRFSLPGEDAAFLAASTRFIAWICKKSLIVYDTITQNQTTEMFSFTPTLLRFDVEGKLLVSSFNGLHKYSIDNSGKIRLIWTCDDMEAPGGIAFTMYGDIVVQSSTHKQMYVVSPQGMSYKRTL